MVENAISCVASVVSALIEMFMQLLEATETKDLWIAGVVFVLFMSIVGIPFRGGRAIGSGGFVGFLANRVNDHKRTSSKSKSTE